VRQFPVPRVLVHPPDQFALRRAVVVVVLDLLERPIDDHSELQPAAAREDDALAAEDEGYPFSRCFILDDLDLDRLVLKPAPPL
jgi:hypothetical protein